MREKIEMKLITETSYDFQTKQTNTGSLYVDGIFSSVNKKNRNGRIYSKNIFEREVNKFQNFVKDKTAIGELEHPESPTINLKNSAILIENLSWSGDDLYGKAKVLNTPCGRIAKGLIEDGVRIGISSRGLGTVDENYVNEDFSLITYDLVSRPSNFGSWVNGVYEAEDFNSINNNKLLEEAKKEYKKMVWQVIEKIEKNL